MTQPHLHSKAKSSQQTATSQTFPSNRTLPAGALRKLGRLGSELLPSSRQAVTASKQSTAHRAEDALHSSTFREYQFSEIGRIIIRLGAYLRGIIGLWDLREPDPPHSFGPMLQGRIKIHSRGRSGSRRIGRSNSAQGVFEGMCSSDSR